MTNSGSDLLLRLASIESTAPTAALACSRNAGDLQANECKRTSAGGHRIQWL